MTVLSAVCRWLISVSRAWFGVYAVPQPERFHPEMELAFALLAGVAIVAYIRWVAVQTRRLMLPGVLIVLLVAGIYYQGKQTRLVFALGRKRRWPRPGRSAG